MAFVFVKLRKIKATEFSAETSRLAYPTNATLGFNLLPCQQPAFVVPTNGTKFAPQSDYRSVNVSSNRFITKLNENFGDFEGGNATAKASLNLNNSKLADIHAKSWLTSSMFSSMFGQPNNDLVRSLRLREKYCCRRS